MGFRATRDGKVTKTNTVVQELKAVARAFPSLSGLGSAHTASQSSRDGIFGNDR
jgi:hypothetical protein